MEEKILDIIARTLGAGAGEVEPGTSIGDLPQWDSLRHLQLIAALEEEFGVKYPPEDLAELEDVSDLVRLTGELIG